MGAQAAISGARPLFPPPTPVAMVLCSVCLHSVLPSYIDYIFKAPKTARHTSDSEKNGSTSNSEQLSTSVHLAKTKFKLKAYSISSYID